jgi:hypothetical protein
MIRTKLDGTSKLVPSVFLSFCIIHESGQLPELKTATYPPFEQCCPLSRTGATFVNMVAT